MNEMMLKNKKNQFVQIEIFILLKWYYTILKKICRIFWKSYSIYKSDQYFNYNDMKI